MPRYYNPVSYTHLDVYKRQVNDRPVEYRMDPETPLLWALRDASNLTGTKYGCGTGECGACTVDIDGEAIRSCLVTIAECEGRFVTTIEGLSRDRSHPVQQSWVAEQVPQCGFCQSGMIMTAAALLRKNSNPSDAEKMCIRDRNECRRYRQEPIAANLLETRRESVMTQIVYPVSYTHLDVYKRQSILCSTS